MMETLKNILTSGESMHDHIIAGTVDSRNRPIIVEQCGGWWYTYQGEHFQNPDQWHPACSYEDLRDEVLSGDPDPDEPIWTRLTKEQIRQSFDIEAHARELREALPGLDEQEALHLAKEAMNHW